MEAYPRVAVERAMKIQEVILRAVAKKITWAQAGEIVGLCERQIRRWKQRYEEFGYDGLSIIAWETQSQARADGGHPHRCVLQGTLTVSGADSQ
jgi:hypothetical protein